MSQLKVTDFLTAREAAERLGVSQDTIRRWAKIGLLPIAQRYGMNHRFMRFRVEDVDKMVEVNP